MNYVLRSAQHSRKKLIKNTKQYTLKLNNNKSK